MPRIWLIVPFLVTALVAAGNAQDAPSDAQVKAALERSTAFIRSISTEGGYLWRYSLDLKTRAGERPATDTQIWVQPPGTPSMGLALLRAHEATGDPRYLEAANHAADALARGQLESGGWDYLIDFDPQEAKRWYRRTDRGKLAGAEAARRRNRTTFDDDNTQSALRLLMAVTDERYGSDDERYRRLVEARNYGLRGLVKAQYPVGGWPQRYPPPKTGYGGHHTFNDNAIRNCILTLLEAHRRYRKPEYLAAAKKGGDFIILSQLPKPQAGWAQQYDMDLKPAAARRFEPVSVCAGESSGVVRTLVDLYLYTGLTKYLEPIPPAIEWFERSKIGPNQWARFYEVGSNKPLYFTKDYKLVYTDDDLPTHYSFKGSYGIPATIRYYEEVKRLGRDGYRKRREPEPLSAKQKADRRNSLAPRVREVLETLDGKGRWLTNGQIETRTFIRNVKTLCDYLEASK